MTADKPLLSVVCITYNHEPFIAKMIEGVLMQQTNFPIEFIIAEDCSTDKTREIVSDYALRYPNLIKLIISDYNVGAVANERRAMLQANGEYIAFCEGDDYWTDPYKLQKQVDFLETHLDYSVCFHRCKHHDVETNQWEDDECGYLFSKNDEKQGVDISTEMFLNNWVTQPLTMVYRKTAFDLNIALRYKYYRDMHLIYHLLQAGKGYLFAFIGGVRLIHNGGMHSKTSLQQQCEISIEVSKEMYLNNKNDSILKNYYLRSLDWSIYTFINYRFNARKSMIYIYEYLYHSGSFKKFAKNLILYANPKFKQSK